MLNENNGIDNNNLQLIVAAIDSISSEIDPNLLFERNIESYSYDATLYEGDFFSFVKQNILTIEQLLEFNFSRFNFLNNEEQLTKMLRIFDLYTTNLNIVFDQASASSDLRFYSLDSNICIANATVISDIANLTERVGHKINTKVQNLQMRFNGLIERCRSLSYIESDPVAGIRYYAIIRLIERLRRTRTLSARFVNEIRLVIDNVNNSRHNNCTCFTIC